MNIQDLAEAKNNFVAREVNNELILVPLRNNVADMTRIYTLNELGNFIWNEIQIDSTLESITEKIVLEYHVETDVAYADLVEFLEELTNYISNI